MIVSSNAWLAPLSPPQEIQGTPEDETGFGQLLTEIENQATLLSGQEDGERRALESVLQFLVTMFQALTPATPLQAGTAPGAGASGLASGPTTEGAALGAALTPLSALGREASGIARLLLRVTSDASPSTGQLSVSDGTSVASSSLTTVLQESFSIVAAADSVTHTAAGQGGPLVVPASPNAVPAAGQASQAPALPDTRPFAAGDAALQVRRVLLEGSPLAAVAPATAATHTAVPHLAESLTSAPTIPQGTASVQEAAEAHRATELPQQALEATPGLPHLSDGSFISPRPGGTSSTTAVETGATAPSSSHTPEGVDTRQWPRSLPSNTVLLHLEPRELGTLLVQVRVIEKRLIASFRAQSPEVESLLRAHLPALHEALSQRGFEVQPIAVSVAAEGFSTHTGAGSGTFTQQHSTFHAFAQEQSVADTGETRNEAEVSSILHQPTARGDRLLDVLI